MSRVIEVDVGELWNNTYGSSQLGDIHLATGRMLLEDLSAPPGKLPLYEYMMSRQYPRNKPRRAIIAYLNKYKRVFKIIKERGYVRQSKPDSTDGSKLGLIPVRMMPNGTVCLKDGHRRLTAIRVIEKQKRIKVEVV